MMSVTSSLTPGMRRELVGDALDPDARDRGAPQRREQDAAEAVAERVAEALVEGLDRECAFVVLDVLGGDRRGSGNSGRVVIALPSVAVFGEPGYFEYSSTMSCSGNRRRRSRLAPGAAGPWR